MHGLCGHPYKTWLWKSKSNGESIATDQERVRFRDRFRGSKSSANPQLSEHQKEKRVYWPADLLPSIVEDARIITYGYDADAFGGMFQGHNKNSVLQHGNDLMVKIEKSLRNDVSVGYLP